MTSYSGVEHFPDIQKFTGDRVHFPKAGRRADCAISLAPRSFRDTQQTIAARSEKENIKYLVF